MGQQAVYTLILCSTEVLYLAAKAAGVMQAAAVEVGIAAATAAAEVAVEAPAAGDGPAALYHTWAPSLYTA